MARWVAASCVSKDSHSAVARWVAASCLSKDSHSAVARWVTARWPVAAVGGEEETCTVNYNIQLARTFLSTITYDI